jgi:iron complex outermembrane recepter protein
LGRSSRVPDGVERYFALKRADADWVGNPALVPATNTELDLGARVAVSGFSMDASLFRSWLDDFIVVVNAPRRDAGPGNASARSYANNGAAMWGGEATARFTVAKQVLFAAGVAYVRGTQDLDAALGITDPDLPEMAPLTGRASVRFDTGRWFVEAEAVGAAAQDRVDDDLQESRTPGWGIVNLRAGVTLRLFSIFAGVGNVFDRYYYESLSYQRDPFRSGAKVPEPGRAISLSAQFRY